MIYKPLTNNSTSLMIEDIKEYLKGDLPSQVTIDTGDLPHLIGEIERLNNIINKAIEIYEKRNSIKYKKKRFMEDKSTSDLMYETLKGSDKE